MSANDTIELIEQLGIKNEAVRSFLLGRRRSLSRKTLYAYALDLDFIQRHLDVPIIKAELADIENLRDLFEELGHSASTIKRRFSCLSSFYEFHVRHGSIQANPVKLLDLPQRITTQQPYLSYAEFKKLLNFQKTTFRTYQKNHKDIDAIQFRSILAMLGLAGPRLDEMLSLTLEDVRMDGVKIPYVRIRGKGGRIRDIALHNFTRKTLKDWLRLRNKSAKFIYVNLRSLQPLSHRTIQLKLKKLALEAGFSKAITPHALRRTFATLLTEKGNAIEFDVKGMLGHAPKSATDKYVGCSLGRQKELLDKIHFDDEAPLEK